MAQSMEVLWNRGLRGAVGAGAGYRQRGVRGGGWRHIDGEDLSITPTLRGRHDVAGNLRAGQIMIEPQRLVHVPAQARYLLAEQFILLLSYFGDVDDLTDRRIGRVLGAGVDQEGRTLRALLGVSYLKPKTLSLDPHFGAARPQATLAIIPPVGGDLR